MTSHLGAAVFELDWKPSHFNLTNVLTRREEGYHRFARGGHDQGGGDAPKTIHDMVRVKEAGLDRFLVYDDVPRWSFVDRFFDQDLTLDGFKSRTAKDQGDFAAGDYSVVEVKVDQRGKTGTTLVTERIGKVRGVQVELRKIFLLAIDGGDLSVTWEITSAAPLDLLFGTELNLSLLAGNDPARYVRINDSETHHAMETEGVTESFDRAELFDHWSKVRVAIDARGATRLMRHAIETVSQSESGLERTYQGTCFFPIWKLELVPDQPRTIEVRLVVGEV
jgi:alpha-amylase